MEAASFPKIFVVILSHNSRETLRECLGNIFHSDYPNFEVVLVDNASTDGSFEDARIAFSRAHFIQSPVNGGFGAGNNLGIRFSLEKMADYIFLLNPDALIEKDTLSVLAAADRENPRAGMLSPLIFEGRSEKIWFAGGKIDWGKMRADHLRNISSQDPYPTGYLSGCALFIRKELFKKVELFDEDYFLYYEDTDLSWRARKEGFDLLVVPQARVFHLEKSADNPAFKTYWLVFSGLLFFDKNSPLWRKPWIKLYVFLRKIKNRRDLKAPGRPLAETVKKAYNDYALWKKNRPKYPS